MMPVGGPLSLLLCAALLLALQLPNHRVGALPSLKRCDEQAGSDSLGVPELFADGVVGFHAMSTLWERESSLADSFFELVGGKLFVNIPEQAYGLFAIVSSGRVYCIGSFCRWWRMVLVVGCAPAPQPQWRCLVCCWLPPIASNGVPA